MEDTSLITKLLQVSILPYLYYFLVGIAAYLCWDQIAHLFVDNFFPWLFVYVSFFMLVGNYFEFNLSSYWILSPLNIISDILVACVTLSFAFSYRSLSHKLLRGNDISYGVYIYHMLVINFLVHNEFIGSYLSLFLTFALTITLGLLSWHLIEKKSLQMKKWRFWISKNN